MYYILCGGEALSRAEPPAGPPKFDLGFADVKMAVETEIASVLEEQYFIAQHRGKSRREC